MKKLLSLLLAMMMFAVPSLAEFGAIGGADGPTSLLVGDMFLTVDQLVQDALEAGRRVTMNITIPEAPLFSDDETGRAIADLIDVLSLNASVQGKEFNSALALSGKDVLTLGIALNANELYLSSNMIGDTIVIADTEIETLVCKVLDVLVLMNSLDESDAEEIKANLPMIIEAYKEAIQQGYDTMAAAEEMQNLDYSALEDALATILQDVEEVQAPVVPRMCDAATYGYRLSMDDAEFKNLIKALFLFIKANPQLCSSIEEQGMFPTEESRAADWEAYGSVYTTWGYYENEAEYIAENPTFREALDLAIAEIDSVTVLSGEFVTNICMNDADEIVYLTSALPVDGSTLSLVYTRQSVAQGVSHVCTIDVDGEGASIDLLAQENAWTFRLSDIETQTMLLTVNASKDEAGAIQGSFDTYGESMTGTFYFFHAEDDAQLKADLGFTVTIKDEWESVNLFLDYACLYARNGVDFTGKENIAFGYNDMKFVVNADIATADPAESIMDGNVIRPAALDDDAFLTWFVGLYGTAGLEISKMIISLPESVLMLMIESGMMF